MLNELFGIQFNIAKANRTDGRVQNLASYINEETLLAAHKQMSRHKAYGVDKVSKDEYAEKLEENLKNLVERIKRGGYRPKPSRRVFIPKDGSDKKRPLGISSYEDKLVEYVIAQILTEIYEPKFFNVNYGFRPNRNCHQAVREAEKFYKVLQKRFKKFELELAMEKTKILEFGRFARENREARGEEKPETFDFLGFTFYCGTDGKKEFFRCRVKTSKKKFRNKIKVMKEWIKYHRTMRLEEMFKIVNAKLRGHYQYYGVTDNTKAVKNFLLQTKWLLFKWLNRRSQRKSYTLDTFYNGLLRTFPLMEPSIKVSLFYR